MCDEILRKMRIEDLREKIEVTVGFYEAKINELQEENEQTLDDLASYTVLCSDLKIENEKLNKKIKILEANLDYEIEKQKRIKC